ncbi:hypothetical protein FRB96_002630 [Tulasnella sp. 330]|nr:hypothetical protein FRB96_002630 [Tulasnella sp. 330]KAG8882888.1 hypothetical protein FRB97_007607 [Tulasnella sp. 331]KAG8884821.1 hypothetical protein FRB98_002147 [Tulasnella sp. 332]
MTSIPLRTLSLACLFIQPAFAAWGQTIRDDSDSLTAAGEASMGDAYYRRLIVAHAVFAVLAFLVTVPLAIISARYTKHTQTQGRWLRSHFILNTFTLIFIVIVFTLGYFAVGTSGNIFDNVHHRIGLTIFTAILLQFFGGLINSFVLSKPHVRTPFQNRIHIIFGWLIWGLALAQMSVGMVLYGSPLWAIGLYGAAAGLVLLVVLVCEARIGRREDHNVDLTGYTRVGGDQGSELPEGAPKEAVVNWNGEIVGEKRKMLRF